MEENNLKDFIYFGMRKFKMENKVVNGFKFSQ